MDTAGAMIDQVVVAKEYSLGIYHLTRAGLEKRRAAGERLRLRVVGMVTIAADVSPALAREAIDSIVVHGVLRATPRLKEALADRINRSLDEG
jgi:hypothetical protein